MGDRDETMKKLVVSFALSVAVAFATGAAVLDKTYLAADRPAAGETAISESEALVFRSDGDRIYCDLVVDYALRDWGTLKAEFLDYMRNAFPKNEVVLTIETEFV